MMKTFVPILLLIVAILLTGCSGDTGSETPDYKKITPDEALEMMNENSLILDVRTAEEFATGHIPNAVLLPLDQIQAGDLELLDNKDQIILVYCRSGNRSETAARALIDAGYTQVYDFGGIIDWPYEIIQ